jgi:hypothetical protein
LLVEKAPNPPYQFNFRVPNNAGPPLMRETSVKYTLFYDSLVSRSLTKTVFEIKKKSYKTDTLAISMFKINI